MDDKNKIYSAVGDLTPLGKDLYAVFNKHFNCRVAFAIAFTLPPDYNVAHWATNVRRADGIDIFEMTAARMRAEIN
jgi:hypothetical protein